MQRDEEFIKLLVVLLKLQAFIIWPEIKTDLSRGRRI